MTTDNSVTDTPSATSSSEPQSGTKHIMAAANTTTADAAAADAAAAAAAEHQLDVEARPLLQLAKDELDKDSDKRNLREAFNYLEKHRDVAVAVGRPEVVFDNISVLDRLRWQSPMVRRFVQDTAMRLEYWPEVAKKYEHRVLEAELADIERSRNSSTSLIAAYLGLAVALSGLVAWPFFPSDALASTYRLYAGLGAAGGLAWSGMWWAFRRSRRASLAAQADNIQRKLNLRSVSSSSPTPAQSATQHEGGYFGSLVRINVDNLSDYYTQVRVHTNNSFWTSVIGGGLGFLLVLAGLGIGYYADASPISYIASGSGVIMEFISGVFFYLYNKTVRQLKDYHDSLLAVQNLLLAFRIVEISGPDQKAAFFQKILDFLLQRESKGIAPVATAKTEGPKV